MKTASSLKAMAMPRAARSKHPLLFIQRIRLLFIQRIRLLFIQRIRLLFIQRIRLGA